MHSEGITSFVCVASALFAGLEFLTYRFKVHPCELLIGCEPVLRDWNRNDKLVCLDGGGLCGINVCVIMWCNIAFRFKVQSRCP